MLRKLSCWLLLLALIESFLFAGRSDSLAQTSDASTPTSAPSPTPTPSQTIWFIFSQKGKANGAYFDVQLDAGESTTLTATIGNGSDIPVKAIIYAADAFTALNGGFAMKDSDSPPTGPTTWLDFPIATHDFAAHQGIERKFKVTVPKGTAPGQYITGVAIETAEARSIEGQSMLLQKTRLAVAVLITVPGPITPGIRHQRSRT